MFGETTNIHLNVMYICLWNQDKNLKSIFIIEIRNILDIMKTIIYSPPYDILFGRLILEKQAQKEPVNKFKKDINELFYEGLAIDEFKYNAI